VSEGGGKGRFVGAAKFFVRFFILRSINGPVRVVVDSSVFYISLLDT